MSNKSGPPSKTSPTAAKLRAIVAVVRDALCALALFLLASLLAGVLDSAVSVGYPNLYIVWFALGMIPFVLFAHWRGAFRVTWRSTAELAAVLLFLLFVPMTLFRGPGGWILVCVVVMCLIWCTHWVAKLLFPESSRARSDPQ